MKKEKKRSDLQRSLSELEKEIEQNLANIDSTSKTDIQDLWNDLKSYKELIWGDDSQTNDPFDNFYVNLDKNIENLSGWVWIIDRGYNLIAANTAFLNNLSRVMGKTIQKGDSIFQKELSDSGNKQWKRYYDRALKGETFHTEITAKYSQKKAEIYNYNFSPLRNTKDEIVGITIWGVDVTKHYELEQSLQHSETKLLDVLNNTPDLIARFDLSLRHIYVSSNIEQITGTPAQDFIGKTNAELGMPEEKVKIWDAITLDVINSGEKRSFEFNFDSHEGTQYFHSILNPEFDYQNNVKSVLVVTRNITDIKNIEKSLIKSEEKHRTITNDILDSSRIGIFILDKDFKVVWINRSIEKYFGLKREDVIGSDKRKLINECISHIFEDAETFKLKVLATYSNNTYNENFECKIIPGKNRKERWLEHWSQPITSGLYKGGRVEQYFDISERVAMRQELEKAKKIAEESNLLKTAFLANTSHEIRTPLNSLLGFTELLNDLHIHDEVASNYLHIIENSGNQLLGIVNDIIDISKIDANQLAINLTNLDLNSLMIELYDTHRNHVNKENVKLKYLKNEFFRDIIKTDPLRLKQILDNLLGNALKFTESGSVEFGYLIGKEKIKFFVKDTGPGITKEQLKKLFTRFARFHGKEGTGLGLCISKSLTELLGGEMTVLSEENQGSEFRFFIPLVLS